MSALGEDAAGNLWIGTPAAAMKLQRHGLIGFDEPESPGTEPVWSLYAGNANDVFAVSGNWRISRFDGQRFVAARLSPPVTTPDFAAQAAFRDRFGGWWTISAAGLGRFPPPASLTDLDGRAPSRVYTRADGLPGDRIYRVFEDSRGDLWIGDMAGVAGLARWERAPDRIHALPYVQARPGDWPTALAEDGTGAIWLASSAAVWAACATGDSRSSARGRAPQAP